MWIFKILVSLFCGVLFFSCTQSMPALENRAAVYFWGTQADSLLLAQTWLDSHKIARVYLRVFDIDIEQNQIVPVAPLKAGRKLGGFKTEIVPVVFITQPALAELKSMDPEILAAKIVFRCQQLLPLDFKELQIDADWTSASKTTYFPLLSAVKKKIAPKKLSCTLRLHQMAPQTELPKTDRWMLLAYHTGDLTKMGSENSIFEPAEFSKWIEIAPKKFDVPLDIALPYFGWTRLYREEQLIRLLPDERVVALPKPGETLNHRYRISGSTWGAGHPLYFDDILIPDTVSVASLAAATDILQKKWPNNLGYRALYHLYAPLKNTESAVLQSFWQNRKVKN